LLLSAAVYNESAPYILYSYPDRLSFQIGEEVQYIFDCVSWTFELATALISSEGGEILTLYAVETETVIELFKIKARKAES